ncbi:LexA-binding, inner membrane-associated putative hydrolase [Candidatus Anstonella stagnisolia]|nr:LexA-binding, inner membrane-associated putative hydrolase [Candidatus Anstonella stagnisolia]
MNWIAHLAFSLALFLAACAFYPSLLTSPSPILLCLTASILPDIDHKNSKISRLSFFISLVFLCALSVVFVSQTQQPLAEKLQLVLLSFILLAAALHVFLALLRPRHRGITHSFFFFALLCVPVFFAFGATAAAGLSIGYLSHLLGDFTLKLF